jgi:nicotinate-nucleotide adenylyltransferase
VRLGFLGGTFDPPHIGHLLAASDAYEALELDRLLFVPAGVQPFKVGLVQATPEQRLHMIALTLGDDPRFGVETVEIDRKGLSYTVDTLAHLAAAYSRASRFLLVGEDLAGQLATWREPERIAELAQIVVLSRGSEAPLPQQAGGGALPMTRIATRRIDLSSTEIRARVRAGKSIHGFVTDAVADLIRSAGLYR